MSAPDPHHTYWRENLRAWAGLYDPDAADAHLENIHAGPLLAPLYRATVIPIERKLLRERFELSRAFIDRHVRVGQLVADVGCGTGILTTELLAKGARVMAVDFVAEALELTRERVRAQHPQHSGNVEYLLLDVRDGPLPDVDVAIAIGVAPYVADTDLFCRNVLTRAATSYSHFLDASHWANRIRSLVPLLNVRSLQYVQRPALERLYEQHGLERQRRDLLGSGFLDTLVRR